MLPRANRLKNNYIVIKAVLKQRKGTFCLAWFITLSFFLWVTKVNLLAYILTQSGLNAAGKAIFILGAYVNFFSYIASPVALTSLIFSVLAAINITLLIYFAEGAQRTGAVKGNAGALVAVVGSHCLTCGGSLAAPIITALAGTGTYFSAERFATGQILASGANILGIVLMLYSIRGVVRRFAPSASGSHVTNGTP